jgi:hypothetical protein
MANVATQVRGHQVLQMSSADDRAVVPGLDLMLVDLIAQRVLQLLGDRNGDEIQLLTVAQVARRFQVHPSWVYANARRLGALRLGTGPKAPLRFDPRRVALAVEDPPLSGGPPVESAPTPETPRARGGTAARRKRGLRGSIALRCGAQAHGP